MKKPKIIAISNQKGGAAKTTTTINLAAALVKLGKRVLIIDMDPQGNSTIGIGIEKSNLTCTIYNCLLKNVPINQVILQTDFEGLDIVPSNSELTNAESELINKMQRESVLRKILENTNLDYDYIIIDCPPSLGNLTVNSLVAADSVIMPLKAAEFSMDATAEFLSTFCLIQDNINNNLQIEGVLLTQVNPRTKAFRKYSEQLKDILQDKVYPFYISRSQKIEDSQDFSNFTDKKAKPAVFAYPKDKGSLGYIQLAKEVLNNV